MPDNPIKLDDVLRAKNELSEIGASLARQYADVVGAKFFRERAEPYPAFYGSRAEA